MHPTVRRILGPIHTPLIRLKTSRPARAFVAQIGYFSYRSYVRKNSNSLNIDIVLRFGMGALITYVLRLHAYAEDNEISSNFISSSPLYAERRGADLLIRYFKRDAPDSGIARMSPAACNWFYRYRLPGRMPLARASALFARWLQPNDLLQAMIERACGGIEKFDLSVHFRGNEKFLESGHVPYDVMLLALEKHLPNGGMGKSVFLATDEAAFRRTMTERFPCAQYTSFDLGEVPAGMPRQYSNISPHDKATEALVNIFLLGRAQVCVRTSSYLSAISRIASPDLRTETINWTSDTYLPFPEAEIRDEERRYAGIN